MSATSRDPMARGEEVMLSSAFPDATSVGDAGYAASSSRLRCFGGSLCDIRRCFSTHARWYIAVNSVICLLGWCHYPVEAVRQLCSPDWLF